MPKKKQKVVAAVRLRGSMHSCTRKMALNSVLTDDADTKHMVASVIEQFVKHYSEVGWNASNLFQYLLLDAVQQQSSCFPPFTLTFFRRMLVLLEKGGWEKLDAKFAALQEDGKLLHHEDYLLAISKEFIADIDECHPTLDFPSLKGVSFDGAENVATQLAKEMRTNALLHFRNLHHKFSGNTDYVDYFRDIAEENIGFEMLAAINAVLQCRIDHNAQFPDNMKKLFTISPVRKCRLQHMHFEGKSFFGGLMKKKKLRTVSEMFSKKVCHVNKNFFLQMYADIVNSEAAPEEIPIILNSIGFPSNAADLSDVELMEHVLSAAATVHYEDAKHEIRGLPLKKGANYFRFALATDGVDASCTWSWCFQSPTIKPKYEKPAYVPPPLPKGDDAQPYWPVAKPSVSVVVESLDLSNYTRLVALDPGKIWMVYGVSVEQPTLQSIHQFLNTPYEGKLFKKSIVRHCTKVWRCRAATSRPSRTAPAATEWLHPISRKVGSFAIYQQSLMHQLYNAECYDRIWGAGGAAYFKKYRRNGVFCTSRRKRKLEQFWFHEICGKDAKAKVVIAYGAAYRSFTNMGTKVGVAPGKALRRFLFQKCKETGGRIVDVNEHLTSQVCATCLSRIP